MNKWTRGEAKEDYGALNTAAVIVVCYIRDEEGEEGVRPEAGAFER